ncbi:5-oxoprolinase subunit C family protein [Pseudotabrizicola sp. L79]|uniref:5-oxoprolinase subunit C family protein n=1 Tax=Pseudotabrizicola sp. L79 TaxID=3118402 RepID=UPI002F93A6C1
MAEARLSVAFAGPHVTVQDQGRPGQMRFGVPCSGPMDRASAAIAQAALGTPATAPLIEVSMGGLTLRCDAGPISLAIAGAGFIVEAREKLGSWVVLTLHAGDRLVIRPGPWGRWTYVAFAGDLQVPHWLNSAATHAISGFGGGRISTGQSLTLTAPRVVTHMPRPIPCPVWARPRGRAPVVIGPQDRHFTDQALADFVSGPFRMTNAFDRMGLRLAGPRLALKGALSIPSEPILRGSVQVSGDGVATVLMADHQTTGGYPKIATVLDCDTDALSQLRPQDPFHFVPVSPDTAVARARMAHRARAAFLARLRHQTGASPTPG